MPEIGGMILLKNLSYFFLSTYVYVLFNERCSMFIHLLFTDIKNRSDKMCVLCSSWLRWRCSVEKCDAFERFEFKVWWKCRSEYVSKNLPVFSPSHESYTCAVFPFYSGAAEMWFCLRRKYVFLRLDAEFSSRVSFQLAHSWTLNA